MVIFNLSKTIGFDVKIPAYKTFCAGFIAIILGLLLEMYACATFRTWPACYDEHVFAKDFQNWLKRPSIIIDDFPVDQFHAKCPFLSPVIS